MARIRPAAVAVHSRRHVTPPLPEILKSAGFSTWGFIAGFPLDSRFGFAQGFDRYDQAYEFTPVEGRQENERSAKSVTDAVVRRLDESGTPRNLFLFVHYFDHRPEHAVVAQQVQPPRRH